jgi:hypothetical protein
MALGKFSSFFFLLEYSFDFSVGFFVLFVFLLRSSFVFWDFEVLSELLGEPLSVDFLAFLFSFGVF